MLELSFFNCLHFCFITHLHVAGGGGGRGGEGKREGRGERGRIDKRERFGHWFKKKTMRDYTQSVNTTNIIIHEGSLLNVRVILIYMYVYS